MCQNRSSEKLDRLGRRGVLNIALEVVDVVVWVVLTVVVAAVVDVVVWVVIIGVVVVHVVVQVVVPVVADFSSAVVLLLNWLYLCLSAKGRLRNEVVSNVSKLNGTAASKTPTRTGDASPLKLPFPKNSWYDTSKKADLGTYFKDPYETRLLLMPLTPHTFSNSGAACSTHSE